MPRLANRYSFHKSTVNNTKSLEIDPIITQILVLDGLSCERNNLLLPFLEKLSTSEFEAVIATLLQETIYINRSFSDSVEFLSIWLMKSSDTLLFLLKKNKLKEFFYNTEYDKDGDEWPFPRLLKAFLANLAKNNLTPDKIMSYLFNNFCFLDMPKDFIWKVIGYDQLAYRLKEIPPVFHKALLKKVVYLYHKGNSFGSRSDVLIRFYVSYKKAFEARTSGFMMENFLNYFQENRNDESQSTSLRLTS